MMGDLKKGKLPFKPLTYVVFDLKSHTLFCLLQAENTHSVLAVADKSTISISCA
jgi:hypothetical protein